MYWKDRETCSQIRSSPDKYLDELPFQESKPLAPSEKEEDSTTRNHSTTLEVFLVRIAEIQEIDNKVVECIDLDNYNMDDNGYFSNIPKEGGATTEGGTSDMGRPLLTDDIPRVSVMVKLEDNNNEAQMYRCKLKNFKHVRRRQGTMEQQEYGDLYKNSTNDQRNIINIGHHARDVSIAKQQE